MSSRNSNRKFKKYIKSLFTSDKATNDNKPTLKAPKKSNEWYGDKDLLYFVSLKKNRSDIHRLAKDVFTSIYGDDSLSESDDEIDESEIEKLKKELDMLFDNISLSNQITTLGKINNRYNLIHEALNYINKDCMLKERQSDEITNYIFSTLFLKQNNIIDDDLLNENDNNTIINEGLFGLSSIKIDKVDDKHYKIRNLLTKKMIDDVLNYIENGDKLLKMFEIVTKSKLLFFKEKYIIIHEFFIVELYALCLKLYVKTKNEFYKSAADTIYKQTWLSDTSKNYKPKLDKSKLSDLKWSLKSYQEEFIIKYPKMCSKLGLRGMILALDQGLGKTFTSLALMHALNKKLVVIISPKTLLFNWRDEILKIFKDNVRPKLKEIMIVDEYPFNFENNKNVIKYVILNYEKINKSIDIVNKIIKSRGLNPKNYDIGIIVDEAQNFKNPESQRSRMLFNLVDNLKYFDALMLSGTPIKSNYYEFASYLYVIDPKFDKEAFNTYIKVFNIDKTVASDIVRFRFEYISFRKMKEEVLKLPDRYFITEKVSVEDPDKYLISTIKHEINEEFKQKYEEELKENFPKYKEELETILDYVIKTCKDLSNTDIKKVKIYKEFIVNKNKTGSIFDELSEETMLKLKSIESNIIEPCLKKTNPQYYKRFRLIKTRVRSLKAHVLAKIISKKLTDIRKSLVVDIFSYNYELVCDYIHKSSKTVIFTYSKSAAPIIKEIIEGKCGVKCLLLTGDTVDREHVIKEFKENPDVKAIVITYQVGSTGLTLTEANTLLYADTPYREADLKQAFDRIYRIGQKSDIKVVYLKLNTEKPNIQDRYNEIIDYYSKIVEKVIKK